MGGGPVPVAVRPADLETRSVSLVDIFRAGGFAGVLEPLGHGPWNAERLLFHLRPQQCHAPDGGVPFPLDIGGNTDPLLVGGYFTGRGGSGLALLPRPLVL